MYKDYMNQAARKAHVNIMNVIFNTSCLLMEHSRFSINNFSVANAIFFGCDCSPALSMNDITNLTLRNVTFNATRSKIVLYSSQSSIYLQGNWHFYHNKGGVTVTSDSKLIFSEAIVKFIGNNIQGNRDLDSIVLITLGSTLAFNNSHAIFKGNYGNLCGGLMAKSNASIVFNEHSTANFTDSHGLQGGAISLYSMSVLKVSSFNVTLLFTNNEAHKGGAIFVDDSTYKYAHRVKESAIFIAGNSTSVKLSFDRNTAEIGGHNIYGGWIDWSISNGNVTYSDRLAKSLEFTDSDPTGIASDPLRICICINSYPDCTITNLPWAILPQQTSIIDVYVVAVGQNKYGTVKTLAQAKLQSAFNQSQPGSLEEIQTLQRISKVCMRVRYSIASKNLEETLLISVYEDSLDSNQNRSVFPDKTLQEYPEKLGLLFSQLKITRKIRDCPPNFQFNKTEFICTCSVYLTSRWVVILMNKRSLEVSNSGLVLLIRIIALT